MNSLQTHLEFTNWVQGPPEVLEGFFFLGSPSNRETFGLKLFQNRDMGEYSINESVLIYLDWH